MPITLDASSYGLKPALRRAGKVVLYVLASGFLAVMTQDSALVQSTLGAVSGWFAGLVSDEASKAQTTMLVLTQLTAIYNALLAGLSKWLLSVKPTLTLSEEEAPNA